MSVIVAGRELATDARGYLADREDWSPAVAEAMAAADGIDLTAAHWEIIEFVRAHDVAFGEPPPMRLLVKAIATRLGPEKGNSRYLYRLFPDGPARQVCRYAGLPKPVSCI
jgi:tRNA 2-thiouridine synthesizing protein E